jgi:DNA-binding NarL/FixJ family response regulator
MDATLQVRTTWFESTKIRIELGSRDLARTTKLKLSRRTGANMNSLRILVADDHEIVRRGLVFLLKSHAGWDVCGEARDGRQAVEKAMELRPDIVILDIGMPNLNGLEAARQLLRHNPQCKVLILTIADTDEVVRAVLDAGARGFVLKSDAVRDLVSAVEALQSNKTFFTSRVSEMVLGGFLGRNRPASDGKPRFPDLTPREREIVQLLAEGKSTKEVAGYLDLSVKTAETHRSNIMRKLDLHSVSELVLYAVRNNMVQVAPPMSPEMPKPAAPENDAA